ncbi:hypothetical protein [Aureivirga sp. CE67]|uniref:hypothetical protein n=1 Tax=Aureivirga sp. CE67 TaxID=1788983 RepID=UPI0018C98135|nr:hypothetical protein [Aureivirga sp. CE67]
MKKLLVLIVTFVLFVSCNNEKSIPENFDYGTVENGLYTNKFFEMTIPFNPNWNVQDAEMMRQLQKVGTDIITDGNENFTKAHLKAAEVNSANLLMVTRHEMGAPVDYNPSFIVVAENLKSSPGIKIGKDYLFHLKKNLSLTKLPYQFEKEVYKKRIGNEDFYVLEAKIENESITMGQIYYSCVKNGFSIGFIASYMTEEDKKDLEKIANRVKI